MSMIEMYITLTERAKPEQQRQCDCWQMVTRNRLNRTLVSSVLLCMRKLPASPRPIENCVKNKVIICKLLKLTGWESMGPKRHLHESQYTVVLSWFYHLLGLLCTVFQFVFCVWSLILNGQLIDFISVLNDGVKTICDINWTFANTHFSVSYHFSWQMSTFPWNL